MSPLCLKGALIGLVAMTAIQVHGQELIEDQHTQLVKGYCSACHSTVLIAQNRMSRKGWLKTIRWMQEKHGLWPLGEAEMPILDYLEKHYSPIKTGRRALLAKHLLPE